MSKKHKKKDNTDICDRKCSQCAYQDNSYCPIYKPADSFITMLLYMIILGVCVFALSQLMVKV